MEQKKVIIIGAGISGLCAGCYLQMNGYDTEIYEMSSLPGGLCTSWHRKGYTFDGCIHWLVGSSPNDKFYHLWNEIIAMKKINFIDFDYYYRVEDGNGNFINVYNDLYKFEKELTDKAPEDKTVIKDFIKAVKKFSRLEMPIDKPQELYSFKDGIKMFFRIMPFIMAYRKWNNISVNEFAGRFKNPLLRNAFELEDENNMGMLFRIFSQVWFARKSAGYPIGGSLEFSRLFEKKYKELGGKIFYNSKVKEVLVQNDSAYGIKLVDGNVCNTDVVISAADGYYTIYKMLNGKYVNDKINKFYKNTKIFPSYLQVSLGVSRTFTDEPHYLMFPLDSPYYIDEKTKYDEMNVRIFNFDKTMAPEGKTSMYSMFVTANYEYWVELRNNNPEKYKNEKTRIAEFVINSLEKRFGKIKDFVEEIDVSTPATVIRYTNNYKGSYEGWIPEKGKGFQSLKKTLPGLNNFYMIGQWVEVGGGLPSGILSARNVAQLICRKDNTEFRTK